MFRIICDTSCDWVMDYATEKNVPLVPLYCTFDGENYYKDQVELSHDDFYSRMVNEKVYPKTSLPSIQDYVDAFEPYVKNGEDILVLTITTFFSGSYNSACTARDVILDDYPDAKITVINSLQNSASMSLFLYEAVCMRDAGYSYEDTIKVLEELKNPGRIIFTTETLEYLQKGGRLAKTAAVITSKLNLRPIIVMKEGSIGLGGFYRTRNKAKNDVIAQMKKYIDGSNFSIDDFDVTVGYCYDLDEAETFRDMVEKELGVTLLERRENFRTRIGIISGVHTGPTALGIACMPKYDRIKL